MGISRNTPRRLGVVSREPRQYVPMTVQQPERRRGRPRRDPQRISTNAWMEMALLEDLTSQADKVGVALLTYIEIVLAEAHGYSGTYIPEIDLLPTPITADALRERTAAITPADCLPPGRPNRRQPMKLEEPLRELVLQSAMDLEVDHSSYVRAVLREAAGHTLPGRGVQTTLSDEWIGGDQRQSA